MIQILLYLLVALAVGALLFVIGANLLPAGEQIAPTLRDEPIWGLPVDQPVLAEDVEKVRLPVALRGYRFAETDRLLDRLAVELRERDSEIARLRGAGRGERQGVSLTDDHGDVSLSDDRDN